VRIYKGEAVLSNRIGPAGANTGLAVKITPGMRAYGIRINDVASLAGMIQPNSRVDIMVVDYDPEQGKRVAKLFMSNKRVLAIGSTPERAQFGRSIGSAVASIEVDPDEAEQLAITAAQAPLQLVLRGSGDDPNASGTVDDNGSAGPRRSSAAPARRRSRASDRSRIVPSTPRAELLPPTVFRRGRGAGVPQTDSIRRPN
jgi:Flp pilus assembly protein CpaB